MAGLKGRLNGMTYLSYLEFLDSKINMMIKKQWRSSEDSILCRQA